LGAVLGEDAGVDLLDGRVRIEQCGPGVEENRAN